MHSLLFGFLLAISLALVTSDSHCVPDQWEGDQTAITAYANDEIHGKFEEFMHVSYDYEHERTNVFLQRNLGGKWSFYQILTVFNETMGHRYVKDLETDNCTVSYLKHPFHRICIPDGSVFAGNFFLGVEGDFKVTSYYAFQYMQTSNVIVSHEEDHMIPVLEILTGRIGIYDVLQTFTFRDIKTKIESEHVFDVPEECSEDDGWLANAKHLTREHFFLAL